MISTSDLRPLYGQSCILLTCSPQHTALQRSVNTGTVSLSPVCSRSVTHWVCSEAGVSFYYYFNIALLYMEDLVGGALLVSPHLVRGGVLGTPVLQQEGDAAQILHLASRQHQHTISWQ